MKDSSAGPCRISVIVPTLNEESHIGQLLSSLRGQTHPPDEVIVVDGGSVDATIRIAESFGAKVLCLPGVKEWPSMNAGTRVATGDVLLLTGADVVFPRRVLARVRTRFLRDVRLVGIAGSGIPVDPPAVLGLEYALYNLARFIAGMLPGRLKRFSTSTNLLAVRREAFERAGCLGEGWNADGRLGRALSSQGEVRFFLFWVRGSISSRRLNEMGFWAFNRHFLYVLENFVPRLESWGPVRRSRDVSAANHSNMRIRAGILGGPSGRLSPMQRVARKVVAPATMSTAVALVLGGWAITSTWSVDAGAAERDRQAVIEGSSCAPLRRALDAANRGRQRNLMSAIEQAESVAFGALETTGVSFGKPEALAIRVGALTNEETMSPSQMENIRLRLLKVDGYCDRLLRDA